MRSYQFDFGVCRPPGASVRDGLRASGSRDPDPARFRLQHAAYVAVLKEAGLDVVVLKPLESLPDSVFVEDPVLAVGDCAIVLRPGAPSRHAETKPIREELTGLVGQVIELGGEGSIDGGDVLLTETEALVGRSNRTSANAVAALAECLSAFGYTTRLVETPKGTLHFKSDCGLLDESTIFSTRLLHETGAFTDYDVILVPDGEEAAANIVRVNDVVLMSNGYPKSRLLLEEAGYAVRGLDTSEAGCVDGGLSCMSLRFRRSPATQVPIHP